MTALPTPRPLVALVAEALARRRDRRALVTPDPLLKTKAAAMVWGYTWAGDAVDVSKLNYEVKKGYLKTTDATERLKSAITSLVTLRAKENIPLVKETARKQTAEFVESWQLSLRCLFVAV